MNGRKQARRAHPNSEGRAIGALIGQAGKTTTGCLLWAIGVPLPLVLLYFLVRGC